MSATRAAHRTTFATALAAVALVALAAPLAKAEFGPIQLVSKSAQEQADEAFDTALSADGRYLAFAGKIGGHEGVFRKDLLTGAVLLLVELESPEAVRSANPSISADGRYVALVTRKQLDPADDTQPSSSDVYVADLGTAAPTYELASARNGCDPATSEAPCGLTYSEAEPRFGSVAATGVALSADGRSVAFLVRADSNLTGDPGALEAPAGQVAVRRLASHETVLVTVRRAAATPEPVPGGGAATASEGAAISGDGSTVAWVGRRLPDQVSMLADEEATVRALEAGVSDVGLEYHEPLWRRLPTAFDANPPTRRVVGGGDPLAPGCPPGGTLGDPVCQGPFPDSSKSRLFSELSQTNGPGWGLEVPKLSRDGNELAFVGNPEEIADLFLVDMAPGLSRRQAVRRLTRWVNPIPGEPNPEKVREARYAPSSGPVEACAISPDGNRIAFTSPRHLFPLAPPTLVTPAPPALGTAELYQVDLTGETIERATPGGDAAVSLVGESTATGAASPSYSEDGRLLAFASGAYNLVSGDTNKASDAFVVESPLPVPEDDSKISPRPPSLVVTPLWRMTVDALSLKNGRVRVVVGVPGAGALRVRASARLGRRLRLRRVASARRQAPGAGLQRLELKLPRKLRGLARRKGGLYSQLDVDFAGPGGKPLRTGLDARFLVHRGKGKR